MSLLTQSREFKLKLGRNRLNLSSRTHLMGVLNVTPDSFSDGGRFFKPNSAIKQALLMAEEGADIIDVGGESTRPGADEISAEEESRRVLPVIEGLVREIDLPVSIDTYKSEVARRALDAGAAMINDISALRFDPRMRKVVKDSDVPVVLMHIKGTPKNMQKNPSYANVMKDISDYLKESVEIAEEASIDADKIIVDPGIGFGKRVKDNLEIVKNLRELTSLGKPILIGLSRKSFIGKILNLPLEDRLEGSLAALVVAIINGANILRVHDVKQSRRAARIADAILKG